MRSPRFYTPPHTSRALLSLHLQHLCLIAEGGEPGRGCKCSAPTEEEEWWRGGGCGTPALIQESDPVEVKLPGCDSLSHEHTRGAAAGWEVWKQTTAGMLLCVLFSLSSMCRWSGTLSASRSCIFFPVLHRISKARESWAFFLLLLVLLVLRAMSVGVCCWRPSDSCTVWKAFHPVSCLLYTCAPHVLHTDWNLWVWNLKLDDDGDDVCVCSPWVPLKSGFIDLFFH